MKINQIPETTADSRNERRDEANKMLERLDSAVKSNPEDADRLRRLAVQSPALFSVFSTTESVRQQIVKRISEGISRPVMLAELDVLKKQLDYDTAPPLERLLIDHVLTLHLRAIHAEQSYNESVMNRPATYMDAEYRDKLLSSTQARLFKAIETLARVRRLARNMPALQINIAHGGGRQVNVQGDVDGQKAE